jgi:hypothetical protein
MTGPDSGSKAFSWVWFVWFAVLILLLFQNVWDVPLILSHSFLPILFSYTQHISLSSLFKVQNLTLIFLPFFYTQYWSALFRCLVFIMFIVLVKECCTSSRRLTSHYNFIAKFLNRTVADFGIVCIKEKLITLLSCVFSWFGSKSFQRRNINWIFIT